MSSHNNAGSHAGPKRRIMRTLKINEISAVDVPAQEGAVAVIMKRDDGVSAHSPASQTDTKTEKRVWLTNSVEGHSHLVDEQNYDGQFKEGGETSWTQSEGEEYSHSHPWIRSVDGQTITIGEADGHGHDVLETTVKANVTEAAGETGNKVGIQEDDPMTDKNQTADDQPTVDELKKQLAHANQVAALNDAEKAHFEILKGDEADAFLAKSADERKAVVDDVAKRAADAAEAAKGDDAVVYTTLDGIELRKSAGEAFIAMAKSNDALRKRLDESEDARAQDALEKRAETELTHIPGDVKTRTAMLKALDGIEDKGQREAAHNALKAQNEALSKAFDTAGHGSTPAPGSPDDELERLAKEHLDKNSDLTYEAAYDAVLKTGQGQELYNKSIN